ncbi:MAG TPA: pyrrolo-quinoline quinone [Verrucomicrobiales bacterium]|nr:pyrrolo-quinoline quinone [Verrucomicrobiales bacterium]
MDSHKQISLTSVLLVFCLLSCFVRGEKDGITWPQWRGPTRNGKVSEGKPWPDSLNDQHLKQIWRIELSNGYSSPIVTDNHVIVLETRDKKYEIARALDPKTGKEIWKQKWDGSMEVIPMGARTGSWIKSTPTYDGSRLYISGMRDLLVCLDEKSGSEIWRVDFMHRYGTPIPELGFICSPLVVDNSIYVQTADSVVCLDKVTGESKWRSMIEEEKGHGSYSSLGIDSVQGSLQILVAMISDIAGLNPGTGEILWSQRLDSIERGCILTPIVYRDQIFTSTRQSRSGMYRLSRAGTNFNVSKIWKNKATVYMSAPILMNDYAYLHLKTSRLACLNLKTGEEEWTSSKRFGFYCSMISKEDRILALSNEGELLLFRATPTRFEAIDSRKICDAEVWGHLAIAGGRLFIRELNAITAYQWE